MKIPSDAILPEEKLTRYFFSSLPSQQVDHVVIRLNGRVIGRDGKPIQGSIKNDPVSAHILLKDWLQWKTWKEFSLNKEEVKMKFPEQDFLITDFIPILKMNTTHQKPQTFIRIMNFEWV